MRPLVAHCHLGLGRAHAGDGGKAREHLTTALAMYRELDMQSWPEQAESAVRAV